MPIKDNRSSIEASNIMTEIDKSNDSTVLSSIIDTADFDDGVTFVFNFLKATGTPSIVVTKIEESDDSTMATGVTTVPTANLIGTLPTLTAADAENASLNTVGVFGTKRFIRAAVDFTVSPDPVDFVAWVYKTDEVKPAIHPNDGN